MTLGPDIIAIFISILALSLSLYQLITDNSRLKKEATLKAYRELQEDVFDDLMT